MKNLSYLLLFGLFALASSCADEYDTQNSLNTLTEAEKARNYLVYQELPVLFGKVSLDENGEWATGWTVNKFGGILNHEFNKDQSPNSDLEITVEQMRSIAQSGTGDMKVESNIELRDQLLLFESSSKDLSFDTQASELYFGVVRSVQRNGNSEVAGCGIGSSEDHDAQNTHKILYLADELNAIEKTEIKNLVAWLKGINSDLN